MIISHRHMLRFYYNAKHYKWSLKKIVFKIFTTSEFYGCLGHVMQKMLTVGCETELASLSDFFDQLLHCLNLITQTVVYLLKLVFSLSGKMNCAFVSHFS